MASYDDFAMSSPYQDQRDFVLFAGKQTPSSQDLPSTLPYSPPTLATENNYISHETIFSPPAMAYPNGYGQYNWDAQLDSQDLQYFHRHSHNGSPAHSAPHAWECHPPILSAASDSGTSIKSTTSSPVGSPSRRSVTNNQLEAWTQLHSLEFRPHIVQSEYCYDEALFTTSVEFDTVVALDKVPNCIDPHLVSTFAGHPPLTAVCYPTVNDPSPLSGPVFDHATSPVSSTTSFESHHRSRSRSFKSWGSHSPYLPKNTFRPYPQRPQAKRTPSSGQARLSVAAQAKERSNMEAESKERGQCPMPDCGKFFKDLKAHMLTHQNERPEKCPIVSCDFHTRGFARRYDRNRHTLTHYRGTMVCGFCPGSGTPSEKTFNRADVFKRHLTKMHGVEQIPPNSRKRSTQSSQNVASYSSDATGKCSTCSVTFRTVQDFYEHLDDCVLRIVQQIDPCETVNEMALRSVADDEAVRDTLDRHGLSHSAGFVMWSPTDEASDEDAGQDQADEGEIAHGSRSSKSGVTPHVARGKITKPTRGSSGGRARAGPASSRGSAAAGGKGRHAKKNYPLSWGYPVDRLRMKKRVLCVYDGPRRLVKDDMMLDTQFEVRITLPHGNGAYVTDLDVETLRRAEAFHNATDEEKGPWVSHNVPGVDLAQLMA